MYKKDKIILKCIGCGKEFKRSGCDVRKGRIKYCSHKCYMEHFVPWNKGLIQPRDKNIKEKKCMFCGKVFTNWEHHVFGKFFEKMRFCSKDCWYNHQNKCKNEYWKNTHSDYVNIQEVALKNQGYRVIKTGGALPDLIAVKDGKIYAIEVETGTQRPQYNKYTDSIKEMYDDIIWILKPKGIGYHKNHKK